MSYKIVNLTIAQKEKYLNLPEGEKEFYLSVISNINKRSDWSLEKWKSEAPAFLNGIQKDFPDEYKDLMQKAIENDAISNMPLDSMFNEEEGFNPFSLEYRTTNHTKAFVPQKRQNSNDIKDSWSLDDWQTKDPKGLEELERKYPERVKQLFNTKYKMKTTDKNQNDRRDLNRLLVDRAEWTFNEWQEKDPKGLEALHNEMPERFTELFNEQVTTSDNLNRKIAQRQTWTFNDWQEKDPKGLDYMEKNNTNKFDELFKNRIK